MNLRDTIRVLTPYTASSSYTLPELATIAFSEGYVFASDGISSLALTSSETAHGVCVKAAPLSSWLTSIEEDRQLSAGLLDGNMKIIASGAAASYCSFPVSPLSTYRLEVPTKAPAMARPLAHIADTALLAESLGYVLKRSGTDSTFRWASGVTLDFSHESVRAYMTDNITMAISACEAKVLADETLMITHGAAQRLQSLASSFPGDAVLSLQDNMLYVTVAGATFSTVIVEGADELENFLQNVEPFSELETFDPGYEFIGALRRHGTFAGRDGAGTHIRIEGDEATIFTGTESGRIKDRVQLAGDHPDAEICTGASVLARMLTEGATLRVTEEAVLTVDPAGHCALLCAWDDAGEVA